MHIGHKLTATVTQHLQLLLRNCWRLGLMVTLFAMTCWEVNPGQMPEPQDDPARLETSVVVAEAQTGPGR